jgi:hypothetical protein
MKLKSALSQSRVALPIACGFAVVFGGLAWLWPSWFTYVLFGVALIGVVGDAVNIVYIRMKAEKDPSVLERETS